MRFVVSWTGSAKITLLSQWLRLLIQIVGFVVLSRLLSPEDFGLIAMVAVVLNMATLFADFGLSLAGIQAVELSPAQKSNLFWLNCAAGLGGMMLLSLGSPLLALYYGETRLVEIGITLSFSMLVSGIGVQFRVELNRQRRFSALAWQDVAAAALGLLTAIGAALIGWGYWALVLLTLIPVAVATFAGILTAQWWPSRYRRGEPMRDLLVFGGNNLVLQIANMVSRSIDVMEIGRHHGATVVGLYSRASQLVALAFQQVVTPLTRVILPRLVEVKDSSVEFHALLLRLQRLITFILPAALSLAGAVAPSMLTVFLGADWISAASALQVLCIGAIVQATAYIYYWSFLAIGKTGLLFFSELPGRIVMVTGAIILAPYGIIAVAWAMVVGQVLMLIMGTILMQRAGLPGVRLLGVAAPVIGLYAGAWGIAQWAQQFVPGPSFMQLLVGGGAWLLLPAVIVLTPGIRRQLTDVLRVMRG